VKNRINGTARPLVDMLGTSNRPRWEFTTLQGSSSRFIAFRRLYFSEFPARSTHRYIHVASEKSRYRTGTFADGSFRSAVPSLDARPRRSRSEPPLEILKKSFFLAAAASPARRSFARANARQSAAFRRRATRAQHRRHINRVRESEPSGASIFAFPHEHTNTPGFGNATLQLVEIWRRDFKSLNLEVHGRAVRNRDSKLIARYLIVLYRLATLMQTEL